VLVSRISPGLGLEWGLPRTKVQTLGEFRGKDLSLSNGSQGPGACVLAELRLQLLLLQGEHFLGGTGG